MNSHERHSITLAGQAWTACGRPLGPCGQRKKPRCPHSPTTSPPLPGREVIAKLQGPSGPDALRLPKQFSYKILEKYPHGVSCLWIPKSTNTKQKFDSDFRVEATNPFHSDFYLRQHALSVVQWGLSVVIGPLPQIAPKKHYVPSLWQSGKRRRGRPIRQWCVMPAFERGPG
jgi:hypothetical protein